MAQHDYVISDQDGASFLVDTNDLNSAVVSLNSGASAPGTMYAYMLWADTTSGQLKQRNAANSAWVVIGTLGEVGLGLLSRSGGAMSGGVLQLDKGADIASGGTVDLGSATGNSVTVTHSSGTTAITSLGGASSLQAGTIIELTFSISGGTLTMTHNATSLLIPGAANLTLTDKTKLRARKTSDSNAYWEIIGGNYGDGTPLVSSSAAIIGSSKNLVITNNSGTPNSQVDVDADEIILKNSSGNVYLASAVNLTIDITASGANGLDTGSEASGTWYYAWVIYNGTTVAGLLSTSSTAPTLPSGYTYKALVGAIYNDGSSNFIKYYQSGNEFWTANITITTTVPTLSYVSLSLGAAVPPIAKSARISAQYSSSATNTVLYLSPENSDNLAQAFNQIAGGTTTFRSPLTTEVPLITPQTLYYKRTGDSFPSGSLIALGGKY